MHISRAIRIVGSQSELARRCNVTQAAVSKWLHGGRVSAENALAIQAATDSQITVHNLRQDIFGPAPGVPPVFTPIQKEKAA
jgi:DNA-binding transcriptional regulator YdaS (Cro superfamily)